MEESEVPLQVSVIIVSYNSADALRRCLRALELSGEREKFEILVVDNGSFDESPTLDTEFPDTTFLRLPRNFGYVKAANIGMRTAKADFFFFLDPNVEVQPDTVSRLAARLEAEPDAVAVCPVLITPEGRPVPPVHRLPNSATVWNLARAGEFDRAQEPDLNQEAAPVEFHSLAAFLCRAYFLKGLRYIDERYAQCWADAEVNAQIRRASKKVLLVPGARAVRHAKDGPALPAKAQALRTADWVLGAATFAGKHFGFFQGLKIRVLGALWALGRLKLQLFLYVAGGQKIDGTQTAL